MLETRTSHDLPMFPDRGIGAGLIFAELSPRLSKDILIPGTLSEPHPLVLRTEILSRITEHRKVGREETIRLAVRLDPFDLGRILYEGEVPKLGEPSWRALGALALAQLLRTFDKFANPNDRVDAPSFAKDCEGVNLSAIVRGAILDLAVSSEIDYRFSYLELSWICSPEAPLAKPIGQTEIINKLIDGLKQPVEMLKVKALSRFPRGYSIGLERSATFSDEELKKVGSDPYTHAKFLALANDARIPDKHAPDRELFESSNCLPQSIDPDCAAQLPTGEDLLSELGLEQPDITALREALNKEGFNLSELPDDFDAPTTPYLLETHTGVQVFLEIDIKSENSVKPIISALDSGIRAEAAAKDFWNKLDSSFVSLRSLSNKTRWFLELNLDLPELPSETNAAENAAENIAARGKLLFDLNCAICEHINYFILSR